jgi:surface protein
MNRNRIKKSGLLPLNKRKITRPSREPKLLKIRNGSLGYFIWATPHASVGDSQVIGGVRYVLRNEEQLRALIRENKWRDVERTCTSRIKSFYRLFHNKKTFNGNISHWDTSSVTNMDSMFRNAYAFNQPIKAWNTRRVKTMGWMFSMAGSFNQPIGSWETSNVTDMNHMFWQAGKFNQNINGWNTSKVVDMSSMFEGAKKFNQPINAWNTRQVKIMRWMFAYAVSFNQPIGNWETSNVTDMGHMFMHAEQFNQNISAWNTSKVIGMDSMFESAKKFNKPIVNWDVNKVYDMRNMFNGARAFKQDITPWTRRMRRIKYIDDETLLRLRGNHVDIDAFRRQKHRLHDEADAINYIIGLNTKIPLNDARVIAGDTHNGRLHHIWHKNALDGMMRQYRDGRRIFEHPLTRKPYIRNSIVPLRDVLHENDINVYNRLRNGKTVRETRNRRGSD